MSAVTDARPDSDWDAALTIAVQRGLAELFLLNPHDDVDGKICKRTRSAWQVFAPASNRSIDTATAQRLIQASRNRAAIIGTPIVSLQPDFEFRRGAGTRNRDSSVAAIVRAAAALQMTRPQIAYVLATAEHESAGFDSLDRRRAVSRPRRARCAHVGVVLQRGAYAAESRAR